MNTDKDRSHSYLAAYRQLTQDMTVRRLLEIGVWEGGSLALWQQWWPEAEIHGVDRHLRPVAAPTAPQAHLWQADAYHASFCCGRFGLECDLIIDDGDHELDSMRFVAAHYPKHVAPGGLLVIEDVPDEAWIPKIEAAVAPELRDGITVIDRTHIPGTSPDSRLVVVAL